MPDIAGGKRVFMWYQETLIQWEAMTFKKIGETVGAPGAVTKLSMGKSIKINLHRYRQCIAVDARSRSWRLSK